MQRHLIAGLTYSSPTGTAADGAGRVVLDGGIDPPF
jgi:hypothetical protein